MGNTSRRALIFILLSAVSLIPQSRAAARTTPDRINQMKQERLFMPNAWADWVPDVTAMEEFVGAWTSRGLNGCGLQIPWDQIEPEPGEFKWVWLDERLDRIVEAGLQVHLRLATQNHRPQWVEIELMLDPNGEIAGTKHWNMMSFADERTPKLISRAMGAIAEHVASRYAKITPHPVVCILPQLSGPAETEYCHDRWSDFSAPAQESFQTYLRKKFESIDELNDYWNTRYGDWSQITLQNAHVYDYNVYRTEVLAGLIRTCADVIHAVPGAKMGVQFGSIWDGISVLRGTRDARALIEHVDWVVIDDYPLYNHAFSMDYLRGHARDKMWGNEVDGPGIVPDDVGLEQCMTSLEHGARFLWAANWPAQSIRDQRWTFWEKVMEEMKEPCQEVHPTRAIVLSLATVYRQRPGHGVEGYFYDLWKRLSEDGEKPIDILTDTVVLSHPEWLAQYREGIYVPSTMHWMTDGLFDALGRSPVPIYAEGKHVGIIDEYGQARAGAVGIWESPPE
jgi:hypothetical protein